MEENVRKKTGRRRDQDQMWKCCPVKLVYETARGEVSRLTRERNWKVWNPPREVVHQLQEPSWQVVCHQCCGFIVLLADPLSPPPRPYFVLGQLQEAWQVLGWLLASLYLFFRASSKPSSRRDIWTLATQVVKHLTILSQSTCLVTGCPTVELLPTTYAHRLAGKYPLYVRQLKHFWLCSIKLYV